MRLRGERGAAKARALVESFRPLPSSGTSVVITGFGAFPGAPRNATAELIAAIADAAGIAMKRPSFRAPDLVTGRGAIEGVRVSLMVLPVLWEGAAALIAKEAHATRASLVVMSGIAGKLPGITIEGFATSARRTAKDRFGVSPAFQRDASRTREATFDTEIARAAAEAALAREGLAIGVACRGLEPDNSYVCNATAHVVSGASRSARVLRSSNAPDGVRVPRIRAAHGFVHWPAEIPADRVAACGRVLVSMVTALIAKRDAEAA